MISCWAIVVTMGGMATLVAAQVFQRYALNSSIDAADELSRLFFVWSMFLALPHGVPRGVHVGIDVFTRLFPLRSQQILQRICAVAGLVLMTVVFFSTIGATADKWGELMPTLPLTAAMYYIPVLICAAHSSIHLAIIAIAGSDYWQSDLDEGAQI